MAGLFHLCGAVEVYKLVNFSNHHHKGRIL